MYIGQKGVCVEKALAGMAAEHLSVLLSNYFKLFIRMHIIASVCQFMTGRLSLSESFKRFYALSWL